MPSYSCWIYFDIETDGLDPESHKVISIQYQTLAYDENGRRVPDFRSALTPSPGLHVLKEWEHDEKIILMKIYKEFLAPERRKDFEPIGNNLSFEGKFLKARLRKYGILGTNDSLQFGHLRIIDLYPMTILINNGYLTTAKFFGKVGRNKSIPDWYRQRQWDKIERYIREETRAFIKTLDFLMLNLPRLKPALLSVHDVHDQLET